MRVPQLPQAMGPAQMRRAPLVHQTPHHRLEATHYPQSSTAIAIQFVLAAIRDPPVPPLLAKAILPLVALFHSRIGTSKLVELGKVS